MGNKPRKQAITQKTSVQTTFSKPSPLVKEDNISAFKFLDPRISITILVLAALLAFAAGFNNDFVVWDDNLYVVFNPLVQVPSIANLIRLLKVECVLNYHPLTMASLWFDSFLHGNARSASSFIITNVLTHALNTILVYIFAKKLCKGNVFIAFFTALLWGIHPMRTESVIWVAERKDVLYSFFFFLACIQYTVFLQNGKWKFWIYTLIFFLLSCLSKGMAVVLPFVMILLDYWFDKKPLSVKSLLNKIPFFIIALIFGLVAVNVQGGGNLGGYLEKLTAPERQALALDMDLLQQIRFGFYGFWVYIIKLFVPFNQHNYYAYPLPEHNNDLQYTIAPILAVALLVWTITRYRKQKLVFFGIMFFFSTIIIVLQFMSVGKQILSERYTYIPYFGLMFMLICWLYDKVDHKKMAISLSFVSAVFIFLTFRQVQTYKDTLTLFLNSYQYENAACKNEVIYEKIADQYGRKGDYKSALQYAEDALSNNIVSPDLYEILAKGYYFSKDVNKSLQMWGLAISMPESDKKILYLGRGRMLRDIGNYAQSEADFDSSLKYERSISSKDSNVAISNLYFEKGQTETLAGKYTEALSHYNDAMALNPTMADTYLKGKALTECYLQNWQTAIDDYTKLINKGIAKDTSYANRGFAHYQLNHKQEAINDWQEALKINPNYAKARENLTEALKTK